MLKIGQFNQLKLVEIYPFGYGFSTPDTQDADVQAILKDTSVKYELGQILSGFVYTGPDNQYFVSLKEPKIGMGEFKALTVTGESKFGYFFDWGLEHDLYAPKSQVHSELSIGSNYVACLMTDREDKLIATTKIERFLSFDTHTFKNEQAVDILVYAETPLGFKAIVEGEFSGLLFKSDLINKLKIGDQFKGYIKNVRSDQKLDLSQQQQSDKARLSLHDQIIEDLEAHDGMSTLTDKSPPDEIFARFSVSKGAYKKAIGHLYKAKKIRIEKNCLYLNK